MSYTILNDLLFAGIITGFINAFSFHCCSLFTVEIIGTLLELYLHVAF